MASGLKWYLNRLSAMSTEEIMARLRVALRKPLWRYRRKWTAPSHVSLGGDRWVWSGAPRSQQETQALLREADDICRGMYSMLNISFEEQEINWHFDPQLAKCSPLIFGLDINYRDPSLVGNVKNTWEKNRHHHLTILALAYRITGSRRYAVEVERQLLSWVEANPFPRGVNWSSSLELGIRLISWVWIERLLRGSDQHASLFGDDGVLWQSIYWHQWMIAHHYSYGSSANNHLVGEMCGLFLSSLVWPVYRESEEWANLARSMLEREIVAQTFEEGLNREQAFSYHIFSLEFFALAGVEADRFGCPFSSPYTELLRRMLEVIPPLMDFGGNLPTYGDADEGMAVQLRPMSSSRLAWLYRLGRAWLGAELPIPEQDEGLLASCLLWPEEREMGTPTSRSARSIGFDQAGLYMLAANRGTRDEILCLVDAGPHGYLSIAAHGHADALSFTLNVGGRPILVDPGTYVYHANTAWRDYFRSTKAHNTITVDNLDQSVSGGSFLWVKKASTTVLDWTPSLGGGTLIAEHDGYARLSGRVIHRRSFSLDNSRIKIVDEILGEGQHLLEWRLHFAPHCEVVLQEEHCRISWDGGTVMLRPDARWQWRLERGTREAGWYSPGFNLKVETWTLVGTTSATLPITTNHVLEVYHES